jgi:O-antigen ligase
MTIRIGNRLTLSRVASAAMAETRLAARAAPSLIRHVAPIVAWAAASIFLGLVVGFAAVVLPPTGAFGIVAVVGVVLLWATPDLPLVSLGAIRKTFFVMLIADLCVPYYYTVQISSLPWISARRFATFALIVPFLLGIASSSDARLRIAQRIRSSWLVFICAAGFLAMAFLSIFTSPLPTESTSALTDAMLSWYVPLFAMLCILKNSDDVLFILKVICFCAIFNTAAGFLEFVFQHRFFLDVFPSGMLQTLIENNPSLEGLLKTPFRNGLYRASSTFVVPLSFGEFEIIVVPIGLLFALQGHGLLERIFGWVVAIGAIFGVFCSGSRGAYLGFLGSMAAFVFIWSIRKAQRSKASLTPPIVGLIGAISFATIVTLIIFWGRAHNLVLGGGAEAASTQGRYEQWMAGIPFIKSNPIFGHGFALGGFLIDSSIDSYVLSLLLETGVPGLMFFSGLLLVPIWYGLRSYLCDRSQAGAIAGALACSLIAFTVNRLVLSQRENHMLFFSLLAVIIVLNYEYLSKRLTERRSYKSPLNLHFPQRKASAFSVLHVRTVRDAARE